MASADAQQSQTTTALEAARSETAAVGAKRDALRIELDAATERARDLQSTTDAAEEGQRAAAAEAAAAKEAEGRASDLHRKAEAELGDTKAAADANAQRVRNLQEQLSTAETAAAERAEHLSGKAAKLSEDLDAARSAAAATRDEAEELCKAADGLRGELKEVKVRLAEAKKESEAARNEREDTEKQLATMKERLKRYQQGLVGKTSQCMLSVSAHRSANAHSHCRTACAVIHAQFEPLTETWLGLHRTQQRLKGLEDNGAVKRTGSQKQSVEEGEDQAVEACKRQKLEADWLRQVNVWCFHFARNGMNWVACSAWLLKRLFYAEAGHGRVIQPVIRKSVCQHRISAC